jgi:hypothetical protein
MDSGGYHEKLAKIPLTGAPGVMFQAGFSLMTGHYAGLHIPCIFSARIGMSRGLAAEGITGLRFRCANRFKQRFVHDQPVYKK